MSYLAAGWTAGDGKNGDDQPAAESKLCQCAPRLSQAIRSCLSLALWLGMECLLSSPVVILKSRA